MMSMDNDNHSDELRGAVLREMAQSLEDLSGASDDVQLLRMGYAAARLEIESLKTQHMQALTAYQTTVDNLEAQLAAVGAGGVEPLRKRCLHQISEPQTQPVAWAIFAEDGTCRMWTQNKSHAEVAAKDTGLPLTALYAAPQPAAQALDAEPSDTTDPRITAIEQAILDHHYALDTRQHGGVAAANALDAICTAMNLPWIQGAEFARRGAIAARQGGAA